MQHKLPVIVVVDASPRWLYGLTELEKDLNTVVELSYGHQLVHVRLSDLLLEADPESWTIPQPIEVRTAISIELRNLTDLKWSRYRGHPLYLCGLYGDACVTAAAKHLRGMGFKVTILMDASLWGEDLAEIDRAAGVHYGMASTLFPALAKEHPKIWTDEIPYT